MKFKKLLACVLVISAITGMYTQTAFACIKDSSCPGTGVVSSCGYVQGYNAGMHQSGQSICNVTVVAGEHRYSCNVCYSPFGTGSAQCAEVHSYCSNSRYGLCRVT